MAKPITTCKPPIVDLPGYADSTVRSNNQRCWSRRSCRTLLSETSSFRIDMFKASGRSYAWLSGHETPQDLPREAVKGPCHCNHAPDNSKETDGGPCASTTFISN